MGRTALLSVLVLLCAPVLSAQLSTGSILGQILDSSGAVIPGVNVTLHNTDTDQSRVVVTSQDGSYRFNDVPVRNYEVKADHAGFKTVLHSGITLTVAQQAVINMTLGVGEASATVTVTGARRFAAGLPYSTILPAMGLYCSMRFQIRRLCPRAW
jgi:hypothetical protein